MAKNSRTVGVAGGVGAGAGNSDVRELTLTLAGAGAGAAPAADPPVSVRDGDGGDDSAGDDDGACGEDEAFSAACRRRAKSDGCGAGAAGLVGRVARSAGAARASGNRSGAMAVADNVAMVVTVRGGTWSGGAGGSRANATWWRTVVAGWASAPTICEGALGVRVGYDAQGAT